MRSSLFIWNPIHVYTGTSREENYVGSHMNWLRVFMGGVSIEQSSMPLQNQHEHLYLEVGSILWLFILFIFWLIAYWHLKPSCVGYHVQFNYIACFTLGLLFWLWCSFLDLLVWQNCRITEPTLDPLPPDTSDSDGNCFFFSASQFLADVSCSSPVILWIVCLGLYTFLFVNIPFYIYIWVPFGFAVLYYYCRSCMLYASFLHASSTFTKFLLRKLALVFLLMLLMWYSISGYLIFGVLCLGSLAPLVHVCKNVFTSI